ncbi:fibronectin type III [Agromyces luteolus]|uniref:Tandem-95 repeat protein n=1 Tax=Agromyces luteolus TaxID=88373 RepID=A0A7C9LG91_9MICO|nr:Ig-like domain-containing protein [Agromyces luteolus]MUN08550.1 tandem-95 repeat protein [Agromyces luteolus]GLK27085.1 fibronectin type III [Agromyces luteolus]
MVTLRSWARSRRNVASAAALAVLAGVPVGLAVAHQGFPVTDPDLRAREVWVTNAEELLAGRLNRQIEELDAAVATATNEIDVFQEGEDAFLYDPGVGSIERIDPSFTTLVQRIDVPPASEVAYGGDVLAILSPEGELWRVTADGDLAFDHRGTDPIVELGSGAHVAVTREGTVLATAPGDGEIVSLARESSEPTTAELPDLGEHQLAAVGERAVVFDAEAGRVVVEGREIELPEPALRLQQSGPESDLVVLATATGLLEVPLGGGPVRAVPHGGEVAVAGAGEVAAPVRLGTCAHGAWGGAAGRYLLACDDAEPQSAAIEQPTAVSRLEFRVNRDVIVLNDLANGNAWLVDSDLRLVDNWEEVTPPEESDELEGDEKSAQQTFEDTLAERTDVNRPPVARDDDYGVRPERTTVLEVLENDTDPDGDVLTIASTSEVSDAAGRLELIDGGRALQFTPAAGAAGSVSFRYGVDDGRGGVAEASVDVRIVPDGENVAPAGLRQAAISVEQGQHLTYNLLADWNDPDGDDLYLVNASPTGGDAVRSSPDGTITFEHRSAELGTKEVQYTVSDGRTTAAGTLTVEVKPTGTLNPIGTPDFARVFAGETTLIEPLANDLSPSGAGLELLGVEEAPEVAAVTPNVERGTIAFSSTEPGEYVFLYSLGAGAATSKGLVRVQVVEAPAEAQPPIAVKDTAYLRAAEPLTVPVLANDVSPSGRVLAVQSIDDSAADGLVSVEILTNTVLRVTASQALDEQLQVSYTVSDGVNSSTASVTIVPVPPLVKHQPPVAVDDGAIVRSGDIVTVDVLGNDTHPDAATLHLLPELVDVDAPDGLAFTDGDTVRFQAPEAPGVYSAVYTVTDDHEQTARATVRFTVVGRDAGENRAPLPTPLTSRTFAGSAVKVDVPLDQLDPDGDSVTLTGITVAPEFGRVVERTSTSFTYEAFAGSAGTDEFGYEVRDTFGATAEGTIRIGVIPRPEVQLPPKAVDDAIEMKPGRTASVEVLLNDSDPSGYRLHVADLPEVDDGIDAEIRDRRRVVVTAPQQEAAYTIRYEISNGHGGADTAFLQVAVTEDAVIDPPTAEDQVIEPEAVVDGEVVTVDPLADATNPGGLVEDLAVSLEGPNAGRAEVAADGTIDVMPGRERYAVAYRLTNELDDLSAMAFVIVPPVPSGDDTVEETQRPKTPEELLAEEKAKFPAPYLKDLGEVIVPMNGSISWNVDDLVIVPSGDPALILSASSTNAGEPAFVSGTAVQYVPAADYRGAASLTFEVTDGEGADDPVGRTAILTIPITVGDPDFNDTPPTFTPRSETIEAGEAPLDVDLRSSTDQPNPDNIERVEYRNLQGANADIEAAIVEGSILRLSSPLGVQPGTEARISFDVVFNEFTVPGYVDVTVVSSTRAMPKANDDGPVEMVRGGSATVDVLANDFNPFAPDAPLTVVAAQVDQADVGANASVSHTASDVTVNAGAAFTGTLSVIYRIQDGTEDPAREVQGRVTVVVRDAPDRPAAPEIRSSGNRSVTIRWTAPANNNSAITDYEVDYNGQRTTFGAGAAGVNQEFTGLTNGTAYRFQVRAKNDIGWSQWSPLSASETPYGTPGAPTGVNAQVNGYAPTSVDVSWNAPSNTGGGTIRYDVRIDGGAWVNSGQNTSHRFTGVGAGSHTVAVRAVNLGSGNAGTASSDSFSVQNPPPPQPSGKIGKGPSRSCDSGGGGCAEVRITWSDMDPGRYRVYATINGSSCCGYQETVDIGANGQKQLLNHLGVRAAGETIAVRFENVSGGTSRTLGGISGTQWNNLGYNTW